MAAIKHLKGFYVPMLHKKQQQVEVLLSAKAERRLFAITMMDDHKYMIHLFGRIIIGSSEALPILCVSDFCER